MVEYDLMQIIQMVSWLATATGVCFAAYYYVMTLRNTEKIRKRDMVFQKLSLSSYHFYDLLYEVSRMVDWETLEEFMRKYSFWANPEAYKKFIYIMNHYNCVGILLRDGIVDADQVFQLYSAGFLIRICNTFKPWIDVQGINDNYFSGLKFLYSEALKVAPESRNNVLYRSVDDVLETTRQRLDTANVTKK